jgi:hypothetical protein
MLVYFEAMAIFMSIHLVTMVPIILVWKRTIMRRFQ